MYFNFKKSIYQYIYAEKVEWGRIACTLQCQMGFLLDKAQIKQSSMLAPFYEKIIDRKEQLKVEHVLVHVF